MSALRPNWKPHFFHTKHGWYVRFGEGNSRWNELAMHVVDYLNKRGAYARA